MQLLYKYIKTITICWHFTKVDPRGMASLATISGLAKSRAPYESRLIFINIVLAYIKVLCSKNTQDIFSWDGWGMRNFGVEELSSNLFLIDFM